MISAVTAYQERNCVLTTGTIKPANQFKNQLAMIEEIKLMPTMARNGRSRVCHMVEGPCRPRCARTVDHKPHFALLVKSPHPK
jgi:hypothetical protein